MDEFRTGDIVYLKSGSPKMTVETVHDADKLTVTWITDGGKLVVSRIFPVDCLTKVEPRKI